MSAHPTVVISNWQMSAHKTIDVRSPNRCRLTRQQMSARVNQDYYFYSNHYTIFLRVFLSLRHPIGGLQQGMVLSSTCSVKSRWEDPQARPKYQRYVSQKIGWFWIIPTCSMMRASPTIHQCQKFIRTIRTMSCYVTHHGGGKCRHMLFYGGMMYTNNNIINKR